MAYATKENFRPGHNEKCHVIVGDWGVRLQKNKRINKQETI